jgi:hypothetical protein
MKSESTSRGYDANDAAIKVFQDAVNEVQVEYIFVTFVCYLAINGAKKQEK